MLAVGIESSSFDMLIFAPNTVLLYIVVPNNEVSTCMWIGQRDDQRTERIRRSRRVNMGLEFLERTLVDIQLVQLSVNTQFHPINSVTADISWKQYLANIVADSMIGRVKIGGELSGFEVYGLSIGRIEDIQSTSAKGSRRAGVDRLWSGTVLSVVMLLEKASLRI